LDDNTRLENTHLQSSKNVFQHAKPVMNDLHPSAASESALRDACDVRFQRRTGPGGQHRNKVETSVSLTHRHTGIEATASERRSQAENLKVALRRMRVKLAIEHRTPWQQPSPLWRTRCRSKRITISAHHADFPALLAEALNALNASQWHVSQAAEKLQCTSSQLIQLLKLEARALQLLNQHRQQLGLRKLR
jgi:hypothetical protein